MKIDLPYGSTRFTAELPQSATVLSIRQPQMRISTESFRQRIDGHLRRTAFDLSDTVVVVADKTRVCGYPEYLPVLVEVLGEHGLQQQGLRFLIAYGTHPRQSDEESRRCYGDIYTRYPFLHHDCTEEEVFIDYGTTSRGVPIRLRREIAEASCVITMGPICHHYFAGYGGGRKLIFPGCGARHAIYANHSLYLNRQNNKLEPCCQPGILENNPLAEDLFEIADAREADLAIHGILDSHGNLCDIVVGSDRKSYLEACAIHGELCEAEATPAPLVLASCGGYPKDINFIQSHKAIHNASMFVRDGGTLLIFSECRDGLGSNTFLPWYKLGGFKNAFKRLCDNYQGNGGTALAMMTKTRRINIVMVTELDNAICTTIGIEKWSAKKALSFLSGCDSAATVIANASLLVRKQSAAW